MQNIGEVIIDFIDANQNRNWNAIFAGLFVLLFIFWIVITIWVYFDSRQRYNNKLTAILIALFVFIFNIPALIIYVVLRPEHTKDEIKLIATATNPNTTQILPIELSEQLTKEGKALTIHFALNFTPDPETGKSKISISMLDNQETSLPPGLEQKDVIKKAENVEVIDNKSIDTNVTNDVIQDENTAIDKEKLNEVQPSMLEQIGVEKENKEVNGGENVELKKEEKVAKKPISIQIKEYLKNKSWVWKRIKHELTSYAPYETPITQPSEVLIPQTPVLAKSKKKKKNRNRK